ncbi:hypothetical protein [Clostridium baratii]|uniref:hypothetical protein n=1 Tax=Clostridium baratii TaxID=1561 RepID=UPI003D34BC99
MSCMYVDALYNEKRNAIPSWQGYHYQAQVATFYFLKYILGKHNENYENLDKIYVKVECMEDFIIYDNEEMVEIYQAKKTLNNSDYNDVMRNFIFQHKVINKEDCKWILVYDDDTRSKKDRITNEKYLEIYREYITEGILKELNILKEKIDVNFWRENLKTRDSKNTKSVLKNSRQYINKILSSVGIDRDKISKLECERFTEDHIDKIITMLNQKEDDFNKYNQQLILEKKEIGSLKVESKSILSKICDNNYINKGDVFEIEDIIDSIYILIYEKLMLIMNKASSELILTYNDIKEIIEGTSYINELWKGEVFKTREQMIDNIDKYYCNECDEKKCGECVLKEILKLNFMKLIDNCNLEYPKFNRENIKKSLQNKLSEDKYNYLIEVMFLKKNNMSCSISDNQVKYNYTGKDLFVSQFISSDKISKDKLMNNITEHLDIYNEYDEVLTKSFEMVIDSEESKILKNIEHFEEKAPSFIDVLPIKFIASDNIDGE